MGMWLREPVPSTLPSLRIGLASGREGAPIRSYPHAQGQGWWTADVCPLSTEYLQGPLCLQARWPRWGRSRRPLTVPTQGRLGLEVGVRAVAIPCPLGAT